MAYPDADIADLVPSFLVNRRQDVVAIMQAAIAQDYETLRRIGHTLKGISRPYGFEELENLGRRLELTALDENPDQVLVIAREIQTYVETVRVEYP